MPTRPSDAAWKARHQDYEQQYRRGYRAKTLGIKGPRGNLAYTPEDDRIILSRLTAVERACLTGRTVEAVRQRATILRKRGADWVEDVAFDPIPPPAERVCETCGGPISGERPKKTRFCSKRCFGVSKTTRPERVCPVCAAPFIPGSRGGGRWTIYCSRKCAGIARTQRVGRYEPRSCVVCGEQYVPKEPRSKTCSRSCGAKSRADRIPAVMCEVCGTGIYRRGYGGSAVRFCSQACRRESRINKCAVCGERFKRHNPNQKFCSKRCCIQARGRGDNGRLT